MCVAICDLLLACVHMNCNAAVHVVLPDMQILLFLCSGKNLPGDSSFSLTQVVAGNRAGMDTILLDTQQSYTERSALVGELQPTHIVTSLAEIPQLLQLNYCLETPAALPADDLEAPHAAMKL